MTILGAHSPKLEAVRELQTKRGRRDAGRFIVEGPTMLAEAVAAGLAPELLLVTEGKEALIAPDLRRVDETFVVSERAMAKISDLETPPGVLGVFAIPPSDLEEMFARGESMAVLAGIGDPGNAGTLLRTAEIFGLRGAIFTPDAVEPFNPKVTRATMGAIFRLSLAVAEPEAIATAARRHGYAIVAAVGGGTPLPEFRFPAPCLLAIGNERHGVARSLPTFDHSIGIPQPGAGESLNAAVAGGIIFFTFSQQCEHPNFNV